MVQYISMGDKMTKDKESFMLGRQEPSGHPILTMQIYSQAIEDAIEMKFMAIERLAEAQIFLDIALYGEDNIQETVE